MDHEAIQRVSEAVKARIESVLGQGAVAIGPPDGQSAKLILFPYRISPNASLRNTERHLPPRTGSAPIFHRRALPLDICFLLTIGEGAGLANLGEAMQVLDADPDLTGARLQGDTVRLSLEPVGSEELSRIWAMLPKASARTSVVYVATPVWIDPRVPTILAPPVVEVQREPAS